MVRCTCMLTAEAFDVARKPCQLAVLVDLELELSDGVAGIISDNIDDVCRSKIWRLSSCPRQ